MTVHILIDTAIEPPLLCVLGAVAYLLVGLLVAAIEVRTKNPVPLGAFLLWPVWLAGWFVLLVSCSLDGLNRLLLWLLRPSAKAAKCAALQNCCDWLARRLVANCRCSAAPVARNWEVMPPGQVYTLAGTEPVTGALVWQRADGKIVMTAGGSE